LILYRLFPREERAAEDEPGGPLWWPRGLQGDGRHDNPGLYTCMYASETATSPVAEALAPFRGSGELLPEMLERGGRTLALASLSVPDDAPLLDLDDPRTLARERLRPSEVATRERTLTQAQAAALFESHGDVAGLRWWSTLESLWINVTLFERGAPLLALEGVEPMSVAAGPVHDAAAALGLAL
jgi:hypothetical protein